MIRNTLPHTRGTGNFIGFWETEDEPNRYVDPNWNEKERTLVISYLEAGTISERYRGLAHCRVCGVMNGSQDLTDGTWIWPSGLAHYLREHEIRPPQSFVDYVLSKKVVSPLEMMSDDKVREMVAVLGGSPESEVEALNRMRELRPVFERLTALAESRDILVAIHLQEIIQHGCDLIAHLGEDFDPQLLRGIFSTAAGFATSGAPKWKHYTEAHAPIVNENIIKQNSPEGECDA